MEVQEDEVERQMWKTQVGWPQWRSAKPEKQSGADSRKEFKLLEIFPESLYNFLLTGALLGQVFRQLININRQGSGHCSAFGIHGLLIL